MSLSVANMNKRIFDGTKGGIGIPRDEWVKLSTTNEDISNKILTQQELEDCLAAGFLACGITDRTKKDETIQNSEEN